MDYYITYSVGKVKYLLSYFTGKNFYKDGSPFYDVRCFKNKKKLQEFIKTLSTLHHG